MASICWWSLWVFFVLFEFAWKREVSAIINPAKIGMILRLSELPESNQMVRRTFQDCFISILYVTALISTHEIPGFTWKLKIRRSKRFDWRSWTHIHVPWSILVPLSPLSPGKAQFISQIVKIAHKIQNCVYITSI